MLNDEAENIKLSLINAKHVHCVLLYKKIALDDGIATGSSLLFKLGL